MHLVGGCKQPQFCQGVANPSKTVRFWRLRRHFIVVRGQSPSRGPNCMQIWQAGGAQLHALLQAGDCRHTCISALFGLTCMHSSSPSCTACTSRGLSRALHAFPGACTGSKHRMVPLGLRPSARAHLTAYLRARLNPDTGAGLHLRGVQRGEGCTHPSLPSREDSSCSHTVRASWCMHAFVPMGGLLVNPRVEQPNRWVDEG